MKKVILAGITGIGMLLAAMAAQGQSTQVIEIHAKRYAYVPAEITLKKGQAVKLELISDDVIHSLVIDGLHLRVRMPAGEKVEATVTPEQVGDFKGKCGVFCGSGHGKMSLTVHVVNGE
jgi:cytochrome c oxidase subunit II